MIGIRRNQLAPKMHNIKACAEHGTSKRSARVEPQLSEREGEGRELTQGHRGLRMWGGSSKPFGRSERLGWGKEWWQWQSQGGRAVRWDSSPPPPLPPPLRRRRPRCYPRGPVRREGVMKLTCSAAIYRRAFGLRGRLRVDRTR